jgi:hypothetical protein
MIEGRIVFFYVADHPCSTAPGIVGAWKEYETLYRILHSEIRHLFGGSFIHPEIARLAVVASANFCSEDKSALMKQTEGGGSTGTQANVSPAPHSRLDYSTAGAAV